MKKLIFVALCLSLTACSSEQSGTAKSPAPAAEAKYNYKTVKVDSIYTRWKPDKAEAMKKADASIKKFLKSACREWVAKGWSLVKVNNGGTMQCEQTDPGHHCRRVQIEIECRQVIEEFPS